MNDNRINVFAKVKAGRGLVWSYYTLPDHIIQWNFASDDWHCPFAENDLVVGGKYLARMEAKVGSFGFDFVAYYDVVVPGEKLTYTMEDGRKAIITFTDQGVDTEVSISFDAETVHSRTLQQQGWQSILDNFKKYAETRPGTL